MTIDTSKSSVSTVSKIESVDDLISRGVDEVIVKNSLENKLKSGKILRIKFGIDPTAADLHLGHTVALRKLKQFQNLEHQVILIIGDFTATVGDPSARKEARKLLSLDEVKSNMATYLQQIGKILDMKKTEVHYNSEWYDKKDTLFFFELSSKATVQQILKRDDFQKRLKEDRDINMLETLYPILQGYDSVCVKSDLEIGGTDQKFNLLMGRKIQKNYGQEEQDIMTVPLLEGTDGIHKMSKSFNNYIGLNETPDQMLGKIMSIPDDLILKYLRLLTDMETTKIEQIKKEMKEGTRNPRDIKADLAKDIVTIYHSKDAAQKAEDNFNKQFRDKQTPEEIAQKKVDKDHYRIDDLLIECELVSSKSESRRLIEQGGVSIDNEKITDPNKNIDITDRMVIKVGKRNFVKINK